MAPDGYLVLGAAETVVGLTASFQPMPDHRGLYVPSPAPVDRPASVAQFRPRLAAVSGAR
jgi:chemotaxis protein methyltransferase CheR